jgi:hypothetical protein
MLDELVFSLSLASVEPSISSSGSLSLAPKAHSPSFGGACSQQNDANMEVMQMDLGSSAAVATGTAPSSGSSKFSEIAAEMRISHIEGY